MAALDVLVVDDEEQLAVALGFALGGAGLHFRHAATGPEMWLAIEDRQPGVILMDVDLGGQSGIGLCAELRASEVGRTIPVLVLTGLADARVKAMAHAAGADDVMGKPFNPAELAQRLRMAANLRATAIG